MLDHFQISVVCDHVQLCYKHQFLEYLSAFVEWDIAISYYIRNKWWIFDESRWWRTSCNILMLFTKEYPLLLLVTAAQREGYHWQITDDPFENLRARSNLRKFWRTVDSERIWRRNSSSSRIFQSETTEVQILTHFEYLADLWLGEKGPADVRVTIIFQIWQAQS